MKIQTALALLLFLFLACAGLFAFVEQYHPPMAQTPVNSSLPTTTVTIGTTTILVEVANTDATREQGLSGRTGLAPGAGMLFTFDTPGNWGFWMKDMNFSLDIIYADASGTVVSVYGDLSPNTYNVQNPQSSQVFYPAKAARYVLEVPAGFASAHGIAEGSHLVVQ